VFSFDPLARMAAQSYPALRALYNQMFGEDLFAGGDFAASEALTELVCGPDSARIVDAMAARLSSRPKTLLHGDMRADNIFRTDPKFGKSAAESTLTYIDWQLLHAGPPGPEFSQAWFSSLEPDVRTQDAALLAEYHARLIALEPKAAAYTYEMLLEDYALGCVYWWMALIALGTGAFPAFDKPEGQRSKRLWGRAFHRILPALRDRDCLGVVRRVVYGVA
jgi:hypothetical protein